MDLKAVVTDKQQLFSEVFKRCYELSISLKQSYYGVLAEVREEYPDYTPYKTFESFKYAYYNKRSL